MDEKKLMVTSSRYFSTEFNTAIIDGPLRIYFADRQESEALKLYFEIQELLDKRGARLDSISSKTQNMFLMLYPTKQTFKEAFEKEDEVAYGQFGDNLILGVNGPYGEALRKRIGENVGEVFIDGIKPIIEVSL